MRLLLYISAVTSVAPIKAMGCVESYYSWPTTSTIPMCFPQTTLFFYGENMEELIIRPFFL